MTEPTSTPSTCRRSLGQAPTYALGSKPQSIGPVLDPKRRFPRLFFLPKYLAGTLARPQPDRASLRQIQNSASKGRRLRSYRREVVSLTGVSGTHLTR